MHETLDTLILIGDLQGLRTREKIKFLRHGKYICCPIYNTKRSMLLMESFIVPFFCVGC